MSRSPAVSSAWASYRCQPRSWNCAAARSPSARASWGLFFSLREPSVEERQIGARIVLFFVLERSGAFEQLARAFDLGLVAVHRDVDEDDVVGLLVRKGVERGQGPIDDAVRVVKAPARYGVVDIGAGRVRHGALVESFDKFEEIATRACVRRVSSSSVSRPTAMPMRAATTSNFWQVDLHGERLGDELARALEVAETIAGERVLQAGRNRRRRCAADASLMSSRACSKSSSVWWRARSLPRLTATLPSARTDAFDVAGGLRDVRAARSQLSTRRSASPAVTERDGEELIASATASGRGPLACVELCQREMFERAGGVVLEDAQTGEAHVRVEDAARHRDRWRRRARVRRALSRQLHRRC